MDCVRYHLLAMRYIPNGTNSIYTDVASHCKRDRECKHGNFGRNGYAYYEVLSGRSSRDNERIE